jgi:hypothetical protein
MTSSDFPGGHAVAVDHRHRPPATSTVFPLKVSGMAASLICVAAV